MASNYGCSPAGRPEKEIVSAHAWTISILHLSRTIKSLGLLSFWGVFGVAVHLPCGTCSTLEVTMESMDCGSNVLRTFQEIRIVALSK